MSVPARSPLRSGARARGGGATIAVAGLVVLWCATVALPAWSALTQAGGGAVPESFDGARVAGTTLAWAIGAAVLAAPAGWVCGRAMRGSRAGGVVLAGSLLAILLPPYAVFWTWWHTMGPGSAVGDWAARTGWSETLRSVLLGVGLVSWSWPITAWCVAAQRSGAEAEERDLLALDRGGLRGAVGRAWRRDWPGLALGVAATAFVVAGCTIAFDLAQVATWGFELRTLDVQGTPVGGVLRAAVPALLVAAVGAGALACLPIKPQEEGGDGRDTGAGWWALALVAALVVAPLGVLAMALVQQGSLAGFRALALRGAAGTVATALGAGALGSVIALGHLALAARGAQRDARAGGWRSLERVLMAGWLLAALVPATVYALALTLAYNRDGLAARLYDSPAIVALAEVGRFGAVAAWLGRVAAWREPEERRRLRALDTGPWSGLLTALAPQAWSAALGGGLLLAALGAGEVVVTARVEPPGWAWAASSLLNAIHYQQPDAVLGSLLVLGGMALGVAVLVAWGIRWTAATLRRSMGLWIVAATMMAAALAGGCREDAPPPGTLQAVRWFGAAGRGPGRFEYPRVLEVDPRDGTVVVIDRQARIHRFTPEGRFVDGWQMPEFTRGKPTGLAIGADGVLWVADTHYHRVVVFAPDGRELRRWGEYGTGPGQFIFPCDVALGPDGLVYVAEFGGNDRVQVFTTEGAFVRQFGHHGHAPGEFDRPQSLAFGPEGELFVADACNHRLQVLETDGRPVRVLGGLGREAGQFVYPYGLRALPDGTLLVAEFGGARVQRVDGRTGESLGAWSAVEGAPPPAAAFVTDGDGVKPIGVAGNILRIPWAVAWRDGEMYVLDSGHARVLVAPLPLRAAGGGSARASGSVREGGTHDHRP